MTREELIEKAAKKYCQGNIPNLPQMHLTIQTAFEAGAELADAHPANPWHNIADGDLPPNNTYCLFLIYGEHMEQGYVRDGDVFFDSTEKPWAFKNLDYWMEIPKLPSE